jgi:hypothetical protein
MINIHFQLSQQRSMRFREELRLFDEYLKNLSGEIMKQEAGLTALAAIMFSAPVSPDKGVNGGLGVAAKKIGERAVERDIRSIFRSNEEPSAMARNLSRPVMATSMEAFVAWRQQPFSDKTKILGKIHSDPDVERAFGKVRNLMSKKLEAMAQANQNVYIQPGSIKSIHEQQRQKYRGRILRHNGPDREISLSPLIVGEMAIKRYVKDRQKRVGWMKAGWSHVIERIGTVNINGRVFRPAGGRVPQWVRRHGRGGSGMVMHDLISMGRRYVKILNLAGDADGISTTYDVSRKVMDYRNRMINARPYQGDVDKAVALWNSGRIKIRF